MAVITVDTSVVHLADAFNKPMLVLFADDKYGTPHNHTFWASVQPTTKTVQSPDKISDISPIALQKAVSKFLQELSN